MTNVTMPVFKFKSTISDEDLQKATAKVPKSFAPGNYKLAIKEATLHGVSQKDNTWVTFKLVLGAIDGRTINHYVMVPTERPEFNPGSKNPYFLFTKFQEFMASMGEATDLKKIKLSLFEKPEKLVGRELDLDIGYEGYHLVREGDAFKVVDRYGKDVKSSDGSIATYVDRDSAIVGAAELGIDVKRFPSVVKFHAKAAEDNDTDWG